MVNGEVSEASRHKGRRGADARYSRAEAGAHGRGDTRRAGTLGVAAAVGATGSRGASGSKIALETRRNRRITGPLVGQGKSADNA